MTAAVVVFVLYLAVHVYTDVRSRRTDNRVNFLALAVLLVAAYPHLGRPLTVLLYCLVVGLFLERLGVWLPGDTRMFAVCGGYTALFGVPPALYAGFVMLGYVMISAVLLVCNRLMGLPSLLAVFHPGLRSEGVQFPGAVLMALSSLGVLAVWNLLILSGR